MKIEYLVLNILIISGPVLLSFDRKVRYVQYWPKVFMSLAVVGIFFIGWDIAVSGDHWDFNEQYTLPVRFLGLPPGEYLFFITVPFSCLFIWQILVTGKKLIPPEKNRVGNAILLITAILFVIFLLTGKYYTALVFLSLVITALLDMVFKINLFYQKETYTYLALLTALILLFNGFLTARPVVTYNPEVFSNIRIWTIPLEDFGYGYALVLLCTILFEKLKGNGDG